MPFIMNMPTLSPRLAIIDYGAGNLRSVARAFASLGAAFDITSDPDAVQAAPVVVLPGVGATLDTMRNLQQLGMDEAIRAAIQAGKPLLGICVGMQALLEYSEEFGPHDCLGVLAGAVRRLPGGQKIPQIGWNQVRYTDSARGHSLFRNIPDASDFYFVHSFYCDLADQQIVAGFTDYGIPFPSVLLDQNLAGVQFHPEKSGQWGLQLLANFVSWASR